MSSAARTSEQSLTSSSTASTLATLTGSSASTLSSTLFSASSSSSPTSAPISKNTSVSTTSANPTQTGTLRAASSTQSSHGSSSSLSTSVSSITRVSTSTNHSQNTSSRPTSTNVTSSRTSSSSSASSSISTTTLVPLSTFEVSFTSKAPISTTVSPLPSTTGSPDSSSAVVHEVFIDAGNCADVGTPRIIDDAGNTVELTSLGAGKYSVVLRPSDVPGGGYGAAVFMADDGSRCGQDAGYCSTVYIAFADEGSIDIGIQRAGDRGRNMYPLKLWMDDAVTWSGLHADSAENASHCWGWGQVKCPNSFMYNTDPRWTISSPSRTASAYISFCPSDGPALSDVPPNPNPPSTDPQYEGTFILLPSTTTVPISTFTFEATSGKGLGAPAPTDSLFPACDVLTTCVLLNTYISLGEISTVTSQFTVPLQGPSVYYSTFVVLGKTTTMPVTTYLGRPTQSSTPTPTLTSWIIASTNTKSSTVVSGWTFATLSGSSSTRTSSRTRTRTATATSFSTAHTRANIAGTPDDITPTPEPTISPAPESDTLTPSPKSEEGLVTTSWTAWITVNGTTSAIVVGEVGVQTTVPVTYALEPSTTIPIGELSSISVRSTSTALPSASNTVAASKEQSNSRDNSSTIAGATVGTLVGVTLCLLLVWLLRYKRRRRSGDYLGQTSPAWARSEAGGSGMLDLDSEPRVGEMHVEPWVPHRPLPPPVSRRKEMESVSGGVSGGYSTAGVSGGGGMSMAGPSREPDNSSAESGPGPSSLSSHFQSSSEHAILARPVKTVVRGQSQPGPSSRRPEQSHYQRPSLANPSVSLLPTPFEAGPPGSPRPRGPDQIAQPRRVAEAERPRQYLDDPEQPRHNAIPPLYNEAWNTAR